MNAAKRVLVTGASGAIGATIGRYLARQGFAVGLHAHRHVEKVEALAADIQQAGGQAHCLVFDVTQRSQVATVLEAEMHHHGAYWGVVLNAGLARDNAFPALSDEDWDSVLDVNLAGFYNVLKPLSMPMIRQRQGGRIVAISSVAGLVGNRGQVNYSAAKAGLVGAAKALALELASRQITVNCVAPGLIATDMVEPDLLKRMLAHIPMGKAGRPEDVAALVGFLFSDDAAYITRQVLSVNGGLF